MALPPLSNITLRTSNIACVEVIGRPFVQSFRGILGFRHRHPSDDAPILSTPNPCMCDTKSMCRSISVLIDPAKGNPVTSKSDVPGDFKAGRLEFACFERQPLARLGSNPVSDVIFTNRHRADSWPTQEVLVP